MMGFSSDIDARISSFANAHSRTMRLGDTMLQSRAEKAILLALVAASADDTSSWIKTRVEDGGRRALLLSDLAAELQKHNIVGKGIDKARQQLISRANKVVGSAASGASVHLWLASASAIVIGFVGSVVNFGSDIGGVLAILFFLFLAVAARAPGVRNWAVGLFTKIPQAVSATGRAFSGTANSALSFPESIGEAAQRLFIENAGKEVDALRGAGFAQNKSRHVLAPLRITARTVIWLSIVLLEVSLIFLAYGIYHGFFQQVQACQQTYGTQSDCGYSG